MCRSVLATYALLHFPEYVHERGRVEDPGSSVAHVFHHHPDPAGAFVSAFPAAHVGGFADARDRSQWPFHCTENLTYGDFARVAYKKIAAAFSLAALQDSLVSEFEQYELQELARNSLALS